MYRMRALVVVLLWPGLAMAQTGVSDDRVSLPDGPGSLEGIGENVDVDPNMGLMSHQVKIQVPPGYPNMTPQAALNYSSGAGGGVAGMGWMFEFPTVERLTKRGLPQYVPADEWMAGGELVHVSGTDPRVYRARFEKGWTRYTWMNVGDGSEGYWIAEYPDGRTGYFGAEADGTLVPAARVSGPDGTFRYHLVEMVDQFDHRIRYTYSLFGNVTLPLQVAWAFDGATPRYEMTFNYEARDDKLSDCKPGFEELLEHRLTTIFVRAGSTVIRRYTMEYEPYADSGGFSRLAGIKMYGSQDGLHPLERSFAYSKALGAQCDTGCDKPYVTTIQGALGVDLSQGRATLIDINGDSLPDVLDTTNVGTHTFHLNVMAPDGSQSFAAPYDSSVTNSHQLGGGPTQVLDIDGDGFTDILNASTGVVLRNVGSGDWSPQPLNLWSSGDTGGLPDMGADFEISDGELGTIRFLDYDGDKKIDVIRSQGSDLANVTTIFRNTGQGAFQQDPNVTPIGAGFEEDTIELNDINGDGLLDAVQIQIGLLRYKLNLGWGQWQSEWNVLSTFDTITTLQEAEDAELEDLNGDGLSDVVLVAGNAVRYWINRNGATFDAEQTLTDADLGSGTIPDAVDKLVLQADMNGNGTSDIVWIDPNGNVSYLELFPLRPNLMTQVTNGLGKTIDVSYSTSVLQAAADGGWSDPLPHSMVVVESVNESDGLTNVNQLTEYAYHDGYYDGVEKDFRGYARVTETRPGDPWNLDGRIEHEFDVGATDTYYNGLKVREETYSEDALLTVKTMTYADCDVDGAPTSGLDFDVRTICMTAEEVEHREGLTDPSEFITTRTEYTYNGYGNVTLKANLGVTAVGGGACGACASSGYTGHPCGAQCLGDEKYEQKTYIEPASNNDLWHLGLVSVERVFGEADGNGDPSTTYYSELRHYFDGNDYAGLAAGQATQGLIKRTEERVDQSDVFVDQNRFAHDGHGNLTGQAHALATPGGPGSRTWTYDSLGLDIIAEEKLTEDATGPYSIKRTFEWEPEWRKLIESTDWYVDVGGTPASAVNTSTYAYDEFALLSTIIRPGANTTNPTTSFDYQWGDPITRIVETTASVAGSPADRTLVRCMDGHQRLYQTRRRISDTEWLVEEYKQFTIRGDAAIEYEAHTSTTGDCDQTPPTGIPQTTTYRDGANRVYRQVLPPPTAGGTAPERSTTFLPLAEVQYDEQDNGTGPHADTPVTVRKNGLGMDIFNERLLTSGGSPVTHTRWYDPLGNLIALVDPLGTTRTQTWDMRGNALSHDGPDRGTFTRTYDDAGNLVSVVDAEGNDVARSYGPLNRQVSRWIVGDQAATEETTTYDRIDGCTDCTSGADRIVAATFPLGDGSTVEDYLGYDPQGRTTYAARVLRGVLYETTSVYNHTGDSLEDTLPSGLKLTKTYDGAGRLASVAGYIDAITYSQRGILESLTYGNGVVTTSTFDDRRWLASLATVGAAQEVLLSYTYSRNEVGLVDAVTDGRADDGTPSGTANYTYDALLRLVTAELSPDRPNFSETHTLTWDEGDRILSMNSDVTDSPAHVGSYTYSATKPHAVEQAGALTLAYDLAGRMTSRGDVTYTRDAFGRLQSAARNGEAIAEFGYDPSSQRVMRVEDGHVSLYVSPHFEIHDGVASTFIEINNRHVAEIQEAGFASTALSDIAPATGDDMALAATPDDAISAGDAWMSQATTTGALAFASDTPVSSVIELLDAANCQALMEDSPVTVTYNHHDHQGNLVLRTDEAAGTAARTEYYPFGLTRYQTGDRPDFDYTGKELDKSTGLISFGVRYLDPYTGRWDMPDPGFDRLDDEFDVYEASVGYSYSSGDPVNRIDPNGKFPILNIIGAVAGAAVGVANAVMDLKLDGTWNKPNKTAGEKWKIGLKIAWGVISGAASGFATSGISVGTSGASLGIKMLAYKAQRENLKQKTAQVGSGLLTTTTGLIDGIVSFTNGDLVGVGTSALKMGRGMLDIKLSDDEGTSTGGLAGKAGVGILTKIGGWLGLTGKKKTTTKSNTSTKLQGASPVPSGMMKGEGTKTNQSSGNKEN